MTARGSWAPGIGRVLSVSLRAAALATVARRLAAAARPAPPLAPCDPADLSVLPSISVVIPARDEAARLGPCLDALRGAPGVSEVVVVDDESSDGTSRIAEAGGARVIRGAALPEGWAGKCWALEQGLRAATGDWVVTLDADTRPDPRLPAALVHRASTAGASLATVAGRFDCPTSGGRALHAAMLTTLVYRFGPPGRRSSADRLLANGQCMAVPRTAFLDGGALTAVRSSVVEDVALARHVAARGEVVVFTDASSLLEVRMFEDLADTWHGWGRSLALPGLGTRRSQWVDIAVIVTTTLLPGMRLVRRSADALDLVALALRLGTLAGTARAYRPRRVAYWVSPAADPVALAALVRGTVRGATTWKGRTYP